ncbi:MAG: restriction endonuclease [Planctomycetes bacterium RIFCSPLOWO2_12_FULL_39_13]|nr:MAG: restriction endonuclease [Planctomycetes bacterium RIFCSPLOWO2_12_FULL_39_13]
MIIAGTYSFKNGKKYITQKYLHLLQEVTDVIEKVNAEKCKIKKSKEKTMPGKMLYSPSQLNKEFKKQFSPLQWTNKKVHCAYSDKFYSKKYAHESLPQNAYRDMDFVKSSLGVEVQFGKYSFMVYNVCAKMTIFHNLGFIKAGIEIVPVKKLASEMSTGVSYFEQFVWDLEQRGSADIDIPVLILGVDT